MLQHLTLCNPLQMDLPCFCAVFVPFHSQRHRRAAGFEQKLYFCCSVSTLMCQKKTEYKNAGVITKTFASYTYTYPVTRWATKYADIYFAQIVFI